MNDAILAIFIVVLGIIAFSIPFFTRPRYRILEVEHKSGKIDYTVQFSRVFGLPGTWVTEEICMGCWTLVLKGCDLEAAKRYKAQFEKEDEEKRSYRVKKKRIYEESN
jgi:hypothetical protein